MNSSRTFIGTLAAGMILFCGAAAGIAQVSPAEITSPRLKTLQQTHLTQLVALNRKITALKFPFPFALGRYVGLDPKEQAGADARGLEFVSFHERVVLKIGGNYNAAYNADRLTQNQRADRIFHEVVMPVLQVVSQEIPTDVNCDAIGFEIAYHVRRQTRNSDYEGKEILALVLDRAEAFADFSKAGDTDWQEILNRSEVYLNGEEFGLALGARDSINLEALDRGALPRSASAPQVIGQSASGRESRWWPMRGDTLSSSLDSGAQTGSVAKLPAAGSSRASAGAQPQRQASPATATPADVERLQAKYQSQLDALAKEGLAKLHFVEYSPPSFAVFQNRVVLQLTLRNPLRFERNAGSIYKRAAQSFDLFLAPQLKDLLEKIPAGADFNVLDITVLDQFDSKPAAGSEAVEFVCPLNGLRQFANAEITNQQLINESVVLVNGVRIALNLQLVE